MINRHWQLLFSGSHDLIFTTGTNLTEENLFRLGTQLDLTRFITFSLSPFVNFGDVKTTQGVTTRLLTKGATRNSELRQVWLGNPVSAGPPR